MSAVQHPIGWERGGDEQTCGTMPDPGSTIKVPELCLPSVGQPINSALPVDAALILLQLPTFSFSRYLLLYIFCSSAVNSYGNN